VLSPLAISPINRAAVPLNLAADTLLRGLLHRILGLVHVEQNGGLDLR
jgi:hypothetical protein